MFLKLLYIIIVEYWIGGTDIQNENLWIWSSSETKLTFFDWSPAQPNNYYGDQHCLEFNYKSAWNDKECALLRPFICEKSKFHVIRITATRFRLSFGCSSQLKKTNKWCLIIIRLFRIYLDLLFQH